jgi:hypothetical protein
MLDFWADAVPAGSSNNIKIYVINDMGARWNGEVRLNLMKAGQRLWTRSAKTIVRRFGREIVSLPVRLPTETGDYTLIAELARGKDPVVRSIRNFKIAGRSAVRRSLHRSLGVGRMRVQRKLAPLLFTCLFIGLGCNRWESSAPGPDRPESHPAHEAFLVKPYLQWGSSAEGRHATSLELLWHDDDRDADWAVTYRPGAGKPWQSAGEPVWRRIAVGGVAPHRVYRVTLAGLDPDADFSYRVSKQGVDVFSSDGQPPGSADRAYRFVVFGDCGVNTLQQRAVAYQTYLARPDLVLLTGDLVYDRGRISEYREKFWPIYNADEASPTAGAPLLRSTVFLASPGNHDLGTRDLGAYPDALAYFLYWSQPLNGPPGDEGSAHVAALSGPEGNIKAFRDAAGSAYPRMANFSFDYRNAHWTVLDANPYVDWTDSALQSWVERDLAAAKSATWRFVAFHQPGFQSARKHSDEQNMRVLAELFEAGRVDVVFTGHVHNYQRSFPLRFVASPRPGGRRMQSKELIDGRWTLDKRFDGITNTQPEGVIYLVTGAGGASLYNPEQQDDPSSWSEFTCRFVSKVHSLTVASVDGNKLTIRQVSDQGAELDRFTVTR